MSSCSITVMYYSSRDFALKRRRKKNQTPSFKELLNEIYLWMKINKIYYYMIYYHNISTTRMR